MLKTDPDIRFPDNKLSG